MIDPARVHAILVGVEVYRGKSGFGDLGGPRDDAIRIGNLLHSKGVPSENIKFFTNLATPLTGDGVAPPLTFPEWAELPGRPDRDDIGQTIRSLERMDGEDLLVVYWSGHGGEDASHDIQLVCADSSDSLLTIKLKDIQNFLLNKVVGFSRQLLIADACSRYLGKDMEGAAYAFSIASPKVRPPGSEQHCFYASQISQAAINDGLRREGIYTSQIISRLKDLPLDDWDLAKLGGDLRDYFTQERQRNPLAQLPEVYSYQPDGRGGWKQGRRTEAPLKIDKERLISLLKVVGYDEELRKFAIRLRKSRFPQIKHDESVSWKDLLYDLADIETVEAAQYMEFVDRLAEFSDKEEVSANLKRWNEELATDLGLIAPQSRTKPERLSLVVMDDRAVAERLWIFPFYWQNRADGSYAPRPQDVGEAMGRSRLISSLETAFLDAEMSTGANPDRTVVEFIVPVSLFHLDYEKISSSDGGEFGARIGEAYRVSLRPIDYVFMPARKQRLKERWAASAKGISFIGLTDPPKAVFDLYKRTDEGGACAAFAQVSRPEDNVEIIKAVMAAGMPAMVWFRATFEGADLKAELEAGISDLENHQISERILEKRKEAGESKCHAVWENAVLILDDHECITDDIVDKAEKIYNPKRQRIGATP